jgi:endonuclease/exonuclease/phosphatase family metal-dependent hydrolase
MKLVTLNLWGGRVSQTYKEFFETYSDINIWCFQEVLRETENTSMFKPVYIEGFEAHRNLFEQLKQYLGSFLGEFCQIRQDIFGLAVFFTKDIEIIEKGEMLVAKNDDESIPGGDMNHRKIQWFEIRIHNKKILLVNAHLTHRPEGKRDGEKRLKQSKVIVDFLNMFDCPKILVGDFNLLPDTKSIKMIEDAGMRNLIKEYEVSSTRTELYKKELRLADYIFVSSEIKVNNFKVLPDVVSDHSPLYLDFEIV